MANNPSSSRSLDSAQLRVLLVCTGNICRSPLAEQVLRGDAASVSLGNVLKFESAGVMAQVGSDVHPKTIESMNNLNLQAEPHVARQITREMILGSDLILVATTEHRSEIARTAMKAVPQAFTMKEFVRVAEYVASGGNNENPELYKKFLATNTIAERIALASQFRGYAPKAGSVEDIIDPWGQTSQVFDEVASEILELSSGVMQYLNGESNNGEIN
jgi:protein-tyrosine phosphatase